MTLATTACRSVAQALYHERDGSATGTKRVQDGTGARRAKAKASASHMHGQLE